MPGMDGIQLLELLQQLAPSTPVMLITGHGDTDIAVRALRAGAFDLIQKPLDRDYFIAALRRAIETSRLRRKVAVQQDALQQYSVGLERLVKDRTAELEKALRAKDEFLSLVSHELRNPMTVIMGNADALYRHEALMSATEKSEAVSDLRQSTKRLMSLVENLLILAKVELDKLEAEPVVINRLVREQVAWYRQFSPTRPILVELPEETVLLLCNATHIELVLNNLISNADKYSPPNKPVHVRGEVRNGTFVVSVTDEGCGIAPEETDLVFQQFYRSKSTGDVQGMGIGLAVCKRLVQLNGGRIWLDDPEAGAGASFCFNLPIPVTIDDDLEVTDRPQSSLAITAT